MNDKLDSAAAPEQASIGDRIDPILNHLAVEGTDFDKTKIRDLFISLWKFEDADKLSPEDQFLTTSNHLQY